MTIKNTKKDLEIQGYINKIKSLSKKIENLKEKNLCYQIELKNPNESKIFTKKDLIYIRDFIGYDCVLELLYRGTNDGKNSKNIHKKINGKGPTISFIESEDGSKFGGFTDLDWDSESGAKYGNGNTFLFSINRQKKYSFNGEYYEIFCNKKNSLYFGYDGDLLISDNWDKDYSYSYFPSSYGINENAENNEMVPIKFRPIEIEVYMVKKK